MDIVVRRGLPSDAPTLTRVAHAAKRHWKYPEDWIRRWRDALTLTLEFVRGQPVWCAIRGASVFGFYALSGAGPKRELGPGAFICRFLPRLCRRRRLVLVHTDRYHAARNERYVCQRLYVSLVAYAKRESLRLLRWMYYSPGVPCLVRNRAKAEQFMEERSAGMLVARAGVSELADDLDSKSSARRGVGVRLPSPAPFLDNLPRAPVP